MGNITVSEVNDDEKIFVDVMSSPSQYFCILYNHDLKTARSFFDRHKALGLPLFLDMSNFQKLFVGQSKKTCDFTFKKLLKFSPMHSSDQSDETSEDDSDSQSQLRKKDEKKNMISFYELMASIILMSYSEDSNKIRMLFNLFDFDNNQGLELDEFTLLVMNVIEGWNRISGGPSISRADLEKVSKAIFSVRDGRITITEIAEWLEVNKPFTSLLKSLNPQLQVNEKIITFLPLARPKNHYAILSMYYLKKRIGQSMENFEKSLPKIQTHNKLLPLNEFQKEKISKLGNKNYILEKPHEEIKKQASALINSLSLPKLNQDKKRFTIQDTINQNTELFKIRKKVSISNLQSFKIIAQNVDDDTFFSLTNLKQHQDPSISQRDSFNMKSISLSQKSLDFHLPDTLQTSRIGGDKNVFKKKKGEGHNFRNIITIKGKSYTKSDILTFKSFFDKINSSQTGYMSLEEYQKKVSSHSELMKRISVSLYNYLDQDGDNKVTFEQLMIRTIPGLRHQDYLKFEKWIEEERLKEEKCVLNYKDQNPSKRNQGQRKELNFTQIKDFLYIFTLLDKDNDGLLDLDEVKEAFSDEFSGSQIEQYFSMYDQNNSKKLNIQEFLQMMSPKDHVLSKELLETQVAQYIKKKTIEKINRGQDDKPIIVKKVFTRPKRL